MRAASQLVDPARQKKMAGNASVMQHGCLSEWTAVIRCAALSQRQAEICGQQNYSEVPQSQENKFNSA